MDGKQREDEPEKKKRPVSVNVVLCPGAILNCSIAGFIISLLTIVSFEVGLQLYLSARG